MSFLRDVTSEEPRPKPPKPERPEVIPTGSHAIGTAAALIFCTGITIVLFGGMWQFAAMGVLFGGVLGVAAYVRFRIDMNNAKAMRGQRQPPPGGWRGRGDGPQR